MAVCEMGACSLGDPISVRCRARPATKTLFETVARAASEDLPSCRNSKDSHRRTEMWRESSSSLRIDDLPQGLLLHAGGAEDSPKNAARFTEAKRLMERSLGKTILVQ